MVVRCFFTAVFGACLVAILPVAYSSPPDPTWLAGGLYDDADHDDVVLAVTDTGGVLAADEVVVARARRSHIRVTVRQPAKVFDKFLLALIDRAPPRR